MESVHQDQRGLLQALDQAPSQLRRHPLSTVTAVVDAVTTDLLPWLRAREDLPGASDLCLGLSEVVEALTIVALRPSFARGAPGDLRLAGAQLTRLRDLLSRVATLQALPSAVGDRREAEERARAALYFVAPPDRPATEAHVLRSNPRPTKAWTVQARRTASGADTGRAAKGQPGRNQDSTIQPATTDRAASASQTSLPATTVSR